MRVVTGEQIWVLVRTDRDGASEAEVRDSVGPAMAFFLADVQPSISGTRVTAAVQTAPGEWRIGAARPVQIVHAARFERGSPRLPFEVPAGSRGLGSRFELAGLPTVKGELPWAIMVRLWWRAPDTELPYPVLKVSDLGFRSRDPIDADWYLETALVPAVLSADPGDETFGDVVTDEIAEAAGELGEGLKVVAGVLAALGIVYLLGKVYRR